MRPPTRAVVLLTIALFTIAACGDDPATDAAATPTTTTSTIEPPTTTAPPTPVVLVTGDSIVYDVAPAVEAALEPDSADVVSLVTPSLGTEPSRSTLISQIEEEDVDVAIVMVGIWERAYRTTSGASLGDEAFAADYRTEALDPIREAVAANGGRLVLTGPPPLRVEADQAQIEALETIWSAYADDHDGVDFVDADDWIGGGGIYIDVDREGPETVDRPAAARLRRTDGIHLCAEGARRIAAGMIDTISPELDGQPPVDPDWEQGPWTARFPEDECPATKS